MKLTVKLNDFETFNRILFNEKEMKLPEKERWKKFYDGYFVTIPIPMKPVTIEEHQFCHYVYWMSIWANKLIYKPNIRRRFGTGKDSDEGMRIISKCFACAYRYRTPGNCPIADFDCSYHNNYVKKCRPYMRWIDYGDTSAAYDVAHLLWGEENNDD